MGATATNDDARTCGVHVDSQLVAGTLHFDPADGSLRQQLHDESADLPIFKEEFLVLAIGEPAGLPLGSNSETEAVGINFLTH